MQHLGAWYAQAHPTEDFAETFAVWLKPKSAWRREYVGWPAFAKLEFIDELAAEIGEARPKVIDRSRVEDIAEETCTLRQHYERKLAATACRAARALTNCCSRCSPRRRARVRRPRRRACCARCATRCGSKIVRSGAFSEYLVHQVLRLMIERCESLESLYARIAPRAQGASDVGHRAPGRVLRGAPIAAGGAVIRGSLRRVVW